MPWGRGGGQRQTDVHITTCRCPKAPNHALYRPTRKHNRPQPCRRREEPRKNHNRSNPAVRGEHSLCTPGPPRGLLTGEKSSPDQSPTLTTLLKREPAHLSHFMQSGALPASPARPTGGAATALHSPSPPARFPAGPTGHLWPCYRCLCHACAGCYNRRSVLCFAAAPMCVLLSHFIGGCHRPVGSGGRCMRVCWGHSADGRTGPSEAHLCPST